MAAAIEAATGAAAFLEPGARGAFEVYRDDELVYSKLTVGRFPVSDGEVIARL